MRQYEKSGPLSVHAIAGAYVVLLGIDMEQAAAAGLLGFAVERIEHGRQDVRLWLRSLKVFPDVAVDPGPVSTCEHPIQAFFWADYTTRYGHEYTYRIVAMRGAPGALVPSEAVEVRIATEAEDGGTHAVYFNRGVAGSQAYARKFGERPPDEVPKRKAYQWLSRGLFRAMLNFIGEARDSKWGLRVAAYEFQQGGVLRAFALAAKRGADVRIIFDARPKANGPAPKNVAAIAAAGLGDFVVARTASPSAISHNKFIVLLDDEEPVAVWTGSTNFTDGGIFGHSNCGHVVRDPCVAAAYLDYWNELSGDPEMRALRPFDETAFVVPSGPPPEGTSTVFSPRADLNVLSWYADRMDAADGAVFVTAAFGVNDLFKKVLQIPKPYLRYLLLESEDKQMAVLNGQKLNQVVVANILKPSNAFERWLEEHLTGLNGHVKYIHTKYMLIDPLGSDPIVITGSANFSNASTRNNDENMLVIRGDSRVADLYLSEFMRLFNHFRFRDVVSARGAVGDDLSHAYLATTDAWVNRYYVEGTPKCLERRYFAGGQ